MKQPAILLCCFVFGLSNLLAQTKDLDYYKKRTDLFIELTLDRKYEELLKETEATLPELEKTEFWEELVYGYRFYGKALHGTKQKDKAIAVYQKGIDLAREKLPKPSRVVGDIFIEMGIYHHDHGAFQKAFDYAEKAKDEYFNLYGEKHKRTARGWINMGNAMNQLGNLEKAIEYQLKALNIRIAVLGENDAEVASSYNGLAINYFSQGFYERSMEYYRKALFIHQKNGKEKKAALIYGNIAIVYIVRNELEKAIINFKKAIEIQETFNPASLSTNYNYIGVAYQRIGDRENALKHYKKSLNFRLKHFPDNKAFLADSYSTLADFYNSQQDYEIAGQYFLKSFETFKAIHAKGHRFISMSATSLGENFFHQKKYEQCIQYLNESMDNFGFDFNEEFDFDNTRFTDELLDNLMSLAHAHHQFFKKFGKPENLDNSIRAFEVAIDLIDYKKTLYLEESTKESLIELSAEIFPDFTEVLWEKFNLTEDSEWKERAFQVSEKGKSALLLEAVFASNQNSFSGIPEELKKQEQDLKEKIAELSRTRFNLSRKTSGDEADLNDLNNQIFDLKAEYYDLVSHLKSDYANYHQLKFQNKPAQPAEIQNFLKEDNAGFVEYLMGDSTLFVFGLDGQSNLFMDRLALPKDFRKSIDTYRNSITETNTLEKIQKSTFELKNFLLGSVLSFLNPSITRLYIVPDAELNLLPFELLVHADEKIEYQVAYLSSMTHFLERRKQKNNSQDQIFAGFAPSYEIENLVEEDTLENQTLALLVRSGELPLPGAKTEVQTIATSIDGSAYLGEEASESNFKKLANKHRVLHLSMHAIVDDEQPLYSKLLFTNTQDTLNDDFLHAYELYNMKIGADLAVLSACNTGYGKVHKGEGIRSLSHAFSYAGVPATIMSLWKVPDESTSQIMIAFYENLAKGLSKDEALHQAKMTYKENVLDPQLAHPFYWAGFIAMGDMEPVSFGNGWGYWWIGGVVLLLGVFFWRANK